MKQLIPQSKIDEASDHETPNRSDEVESAYYRGYDEGFEKAIQFALNEIQPLMVEFANFCIGKDWKQNGYVYGKTTQQLLEEFINSKNK